MVFLAGVWLLLAPVILDYAPHPEGLGAYWNDLVVGGMVALLALVRVLAPEHLPWLSLVNAALGAWLVVSPFVLDYAVRAYAMRATGNDVAVGVLILVVAVASAVTTYQRRKAARGPDGAST
ncbi:SPW repeat domain-containing protein [Saccharothrix carnea]|uniref:SPW repeat domain-containing protein n=1 Tax=Saccharothrix carnea TaxID=1280637 RepID=UPI0015E7781E|nr:SPW repeat protein [Saccharothrix carnea]